MDILEVYPAIDQHKFQRHDDQRTSWEPGELITRISILVILILQQYSYDNEVVKQFLFLLPVCKGNISKPQIDEVV